MKRKSITSANLNDFSNNDEYHLPLFCFSWLASLIILLLYTSLSTHTTIINVFDPSSKTFIDLANAHGSSLRCPCTSLSILYESFLSVTPGFHQVCSSDLISERWLAILKDSMTYEFSTDWRNRAYLLFQLLADLCQFAQKTVRDALERFLGRSFVISNALSKGEFERQINVTFEQFVRSTNTYFNLFVETTRLLMQVDQPFMGSTYYESLQLDVTSSVQPYVTTINGSRTIQVRCLSKVKLFNGNSYSREASSLFLTETSSRLVHL